MSALPPPVATPAPTAHLTCSRCGLADIAVVTRDNGVPHHMTPMKCIAALKPLAARWRAFCDAAHIGTGEDGEVYLGTMVAETVATLDGATPHERDLLNGEVAFSRFATIEAADRIDAIWAANMEAP